MKNYSSDFIILDSSAWIEIFNRGDLTRELESIMENAEKILVPSVILFEVYRKIKSTVTEEQALSASALMSQNQLLHFTHEVALTAADLSLEHKLSTVDSIILAHARLENATLMTLDNDFSSLEGVRVLRRK